MDRSKKIDILDEVDKKHPYLDEERLPIVKSKEEITTEINELEDRILKKKHVIRFMNDNLKEIHLEIERWQEKHNIISNFSKEFKEYEKQLTDKILQIRQARKEAAMDAIIKQHLGDELRKQLPMLIENYGKLMQEPLEAIKAKSTALIADDTTNILREIRRKLKQTEKKEKTEEKPKVEKP